MTSANQPSMMQVGAAQPGAADPDDDVVRPGDLRLRHLFDPWRLSVGVQSDRLHAAPPSARPGQDTATGCSPGAGHVCRCGAAAPWVIRPGPRRELRDWGACHEGVSIAAMGGATNIGHFQDTFGPRGLGVRLAGLCDAGTRSGRKSRYARLLAEAVDPARVPRPLERLLAHV